MRKKIISVLLSAVMIMSMAAGCSGTGGNEEQKQSTEESQDERVEELEASMTEETDTDEEIKEEGYVTEGEGYTTTTRWCKNGDKNIFGTLYVPEGYDGTQKYPTAIMCHGFGDCHTAYDVYAPEIAAQGMVCYVFDFCTGGLKSFSDGEKTDYSVITETEDLNAVIDFVKGQECVDTSRLVLMGQSMGGLVSSLVAAERPDELAAMVLFYPGYIAVDEAHELYPDREGLPTDTAEFLGAEVGARFVSDIYDLDIYGTIGAYEGPVYILHGTADKLVPISYSERALEVYPDAQLEVIEGGNHGFPPLEDGTDVRALACGHILDFLRNSGIID